MSIITNFGCHYKCPYCVVKKNNLHIPKTTLAGLDNLGEALRDYNCDKVSVSGGGDPLYEYEKHMDWYQKLFEITKQFNILLPIEMHTSYMTDQTTFPFQLCHRVVYHANLPVELLHIRRMGNEIVRVVFVVTESYTVKDIMDIALFVQNSGEIDELSFRQLVDDKYEAQHHLEDYLRMGHKRLWWYIEQDDYNFYYAENKVSTRYRDFKSRAI